MTLKKVKIREDDCIGCTKCIAVCPTDAIIGASQLMHTVISDACIGCDLCIPPCPVDCIDSIPAQPLSADEKRIYAAYWRDRHQQRKKRLAREKEDRQKKHEAAKLLHAPKQTVAARQRAIADAVARVHAKRKSHEPN